MPDGSQPRQLTGSGSDPVVSPDGRFIVFVNRSNGSLRRMDIDGRNSRQLTPPTMTGLQKGFFFTPDGASVVFEHQEDRGGTVTNWKVPIEGGESVPLFKSAVPSTPSGATAPPANFVAQAISGDGRWVTGFYPQPNGQVGFAVVSADGTESRRQLSPPAGAFSFIRGTRDGLVFKRYERGVENLWLQPLEGGAPRQLTSFSNEGIIISDFALSRDGRMLAVSRLEATTDLVMITSETKK
jgi:Tol biopolymer transport system component